MRARAGASIVALAVVCLVALVTVQVSAEGAKTAVVWPAGEIKWSDNPAHRGAKVAVLWGDPAKGPHGALRSVPAGAILALHAHTNDQRVVSLSGKVGLAIEGLPKKVLGPGSYAFIPGGVKHSADCWAGAECVYLEVYEGASDVKYVEETK